MRGEFHLQVKDCRGLRDEDFLAAQAEGSLNELLAGLAVAQEVRVRNALNDTLAWGLLHHVFGHGFGGGYPMDGGTELLTGVCLLTHDVELDYQEYRTWYGSIHVMEWSANTSSGAKGFGQRVDDFIVGTPDDNREEVWCRHRWLWLPSEGNSNNIRSIGIMGGEHHNYTSEDKFRVGRVLLKDRDTGGQMVVVKNINQVLTLEYTVSYIAV